MTNPLHKLYVSQSLFPLARCLANDLGQRSPLQRVWILIPGDSMKAWLSLQLALLFPSLGWAGLTFCSLEKFTRESVLPFGTTMEIACALYNELPLQHNRAEMSLHLAASFMKEVPPDDWRGKLFAKVKGRTPFEVWEHGPASSDPVYCFGFDHLPEAAWAFLFRQTNIAFYLFSPCQHFWGDVTTPYERRHLSTDAIERFCDKEPPLLASLGKLGKKTFALLDAYPAEVEEAYAPPCNASSQLTALQQGILLFENNPLPSPDDSIHVFQTGSLRLVEVECLADEMLSLFHEKGLLFSDMAILTPSLDSYIPLLEHVFSSRGIPYRIDSCALQEKQPFYRGLCALLALAQTPWTAQNLEVLFTCKAFSRAPTKSWIQEMFAYANDWKEALTLLTLDLAMISPGPPKATLPMSEAEEFEAFCSLLHELWKDVGHLSSGSKTPTEWASCFEALQQKYLSPGEDGSFATFQSVLRELRSLADAPYPLELIAHFLKRPTFGAVHGSSLHAVRIASLDKGAILPAKALFLIGMDEESFPRKSMFRDVDCIDEDRYLFLQAIMNTSLYLRIFYRHIAEKDGFDVAPSSVVQELLRLTGVAPKRLAPPTPPAAYLPCFTILAPPQAAEQGNCTLQLSDLTLFAKNPWKYYLQKEHRIFIEDRASPSLHQARARALRACLKWPVGSVLHDSVDATFGFCKEAFAIDVAAREAKQAKVLRRFQSPPRKLTLLETAGLGEAPPIEWEGRVRIVGTIPYVVDEGALHFGDDTLPSLLRAWPEILAALVALNRTTIYFVKADKEKEVANPLKCLQQYVAYYQRCCETLSPLIPEWADVLLKNPGKALPLEFEHCDAVTQWMLDRLEIPPLDEWGFLTEAFEGLTLLYPSRGAHAQV